MTTVVSTKYVSVVVLRQACQVDLFWAHTFNVDDVIAIAQTIIALISRLLHFYLFVDVLDFLRGHHEEV